MAFPSPESLIRYMERQVDPARFKHTLGTWKLARALAARYNAPLDKVDTAALLHDAGKGLSKEAMVRYVKRHNVPVPDREELIRHSPALLHGYVSAHIARSQFHIKDREVLDAIAFHTLGDARMSMVAKVIYLADAASPDRRYPGFMDIRARGMRDLDAALVMAMENKLFHVIKWRKWIAPKALETWNAYLKI
jgi:nicotinate-nucleotide adenylyltransferase